ncbi:MAG: sigma-70 family RNA polymerase sigma factor [Plectolyngbya sp. WJT66-NPBG17]|jgi:RNA polymerase sigma factor (sigma-70 family)|nr:sigma-70 family RNA polymerase sigma factor [Plectolyngbya sp. WJT66-NPBG17]
MQPRQTIAELFSTFVEFMDDHFHRWVSDRVLRQTMLNNLAEQPDASEIYWMLYWHQQWHQSKQRAEAHLCAYVQEPCYWVARRMAREQTGVQYRVSDCFQLALAAFPKILTDYQPSQAASLKTYASLCFGNTIRDTLRQQREADQRTDWGLLRKLSQKQLVESLQMAGLSADAIAQARLAWTCFKTYCAPDKTPTTRRLPQPDWGEIAKLYNTQCSQKATPEELEARLKRCAKQARAYLYPAIASLNVSRENATGELQDDLPDETRATPFALLISQEELEERQSRWMQIQSVLTTALESLDPKIQQLLVLYCRDGLTQQQIAKQLEMKQYTVSRRLSSAKETLLLALARWSRDKLHISLTSPALKDMSVVLEEWLQIYYRKSER